MNLFKIRHFITQLEQLDSSPLDISRVTGLWNNKNFNVKLKISRKLANWVSIKIVAPNTKKFINETFAIKSED